MFNNMWDVKEPKHYSKRVGREVPGVVAVLCVVHTGPMLIAVTTITEIEMNERGPNRADAGQIFPNANLFPCIVC